MGYMGFGMRKEVYTRKPKKVFETYKREFGPAAPLDKDYKPPKKYVSPLVEYDRVKKGQDFRRMYNGLLGIAFVIGMMMIALYMLIHMGNIVESW